jgi:rhamnulokinase
VVGGGSRNALLCQFTADATGLKVFAGPAEATAAGNILVQAMACDRVRGLDGIREASRRSFKRVLYPPRDAAAWEKAYRRFVEICG